MTISSKLYHKYLHFNDLTDWEKYLFYSSTCQFQNKMKDYSKPYVNSLKKKTRFHLLGFTKFLINTHKK